MVLDIDETMNDGQRWSTPRALETVEMMRLTVDVRIEAGDLISRCRRALILPHGAYHVIVRRIYRLLYRSGCIYI